MNRLLGALLLATLSSGGCIVVDHSPGGGGPVNPGPTPPRADQAGEPTLSLGPQAYPGYRVLAGASSSIPSGDLGFLVTANGQGGYRLVWTDTLGSPSQFHGTVTTDGTFDMRQTQGFSGHEQLTYSGVNQIAFSSVPGSAIDGIDLVSSTDPIYVDAMIDGTHSGVALYFTGASTGALVNSAYDPVAFSSP
jgi:hypothetical protein